MIAKSGIVFFRNMTSALLMALILSSLVQAEVVDWSSDAGKERLLESRTNNDFFMLANYYDAQDNKMFCGVASMTIVLNALRAGREHPQAPLAETPMTPEERRYLPKGGWSPFFHKYAQSNVLAPEARLHIFGKPYPGAEKSAYGMTLPQLAELLKAQTLSVKAVHIDSHQSLTAMRAELINVLNDTTHYVLINYSREVLQQRKSGHISPLGAYHEGSDSFLIMDVSNTRTHWVWVSAEQLYKAMQALDSESRKPRGYVVVSEGLLKDDDLK